MARTPTFDRGEVLQKALEVFWADGYSGSTMQTIGKAIGLQPGSIYGAFGNKDALFREALQRYVQQVRSQIEADRSAREILHLWFERHVDRALATSRGRGCLLLNSVAEAHSLGTEGIELVREELTTLTEFFEATIVKARSQADPPGERPAKDVAQGLIAALCGISVLSRTGADRQTLLTIGQVALDAI